jgi:SAM-dependent methyltransferase
MMPMNPAVPVEGSSRLLSWARQQTRWRMRDVARHAIDLFDWPSRRHDETPSDFKPLVERHLGAGWVPHAPAVLEQSLAYACNICGAANVARIATLERETGSCQGCRSTVRLRSIIDLLSRALFGASLPIARFPRDSRKCGVGLSDAHVYAHRLARKLTYVNTYYHQPPRLDVCAPDPALRDSCDFVLASDVLEHVVPPVNAAFAGIHSMLRTNGVLVGSVPYSLNPATIEHFPQLHEFHIDGKPGARRLHNRRRDGVDETFDRLVFHGGDGATLEMREFSRASLTAELEAAGFSRIRIAEQDVYEWGIVWLKPWSIPFVAFK